MAFNQLTGLAVAEAIKFLRSSDYFDSLPKSVIDFGNQRFRLGGKVLKHISGSLNCDFKVPKVDPEYSDFTPLFYKQLGYDYQAIDMNAKMSALPMDLNSDLRTSYRYSKKHSIVLDNGTGEHVFDQHMVFKNQHDLCAKGGIIINNKPFFPWINHGFYAFQPVLFRDLAYANGYEHVFTWLGGNHGEYIDVTGNSDIWVELPRANPFWQRPKSNLEKLLYDKLLEKNNISLVVGYRKLSDDPFKIPLQGKWIHNIDDPSLKRRYEGQPDTYTEFHS